MMGPEKKYEERLKKWLKEQGAWYVKYWGGGTFTRPGVPDLLVCMGGRFVAIEVKSDSGKLTPEQMEQMALIKKAGGIAIVSRPSSFEKDTAFLKNLMEV